MGLVCLIAVYGGAFFGASVMLAAFVSSLAVWAGSLIDALRIPPLAARPSPAVFAAPMAVALAVTASPFVIRAWIVEPYRIPSGSMSPTLLPGDQVAVDKRPFRRAAASRGDVIVFEFPGDRRKHYIKRVVGLPGDVIEIAEGNLRVNGEEAPSVSRGTVEIPGEDCRTRTVEAFEESLDGRRYTIVRSGDGGYFESGRWTVPDGELFVMGDHRDNAMDSRTGFTVPYDHVRGHATWIHLSWDACAGRLRTERIGNRLR